MDNQTLKQLVKLEEVIAETEPLAGHGRRLHGRSHDSLVVDTQEQVYFWNSRTGDKPGDVFTWLMEVHGWTFAEARADVARRAGVDLPEARGRPTRLRPEPSSRAQAEGAQPEGSPPRPLARHNTRRLAAPATAWQERGRQFVAAAQITLWSAAGQPGLAELRRRGLTETTIRWAGLGWNPADRWEEPGAWGFTGGRKIWLPKGVVIPWLIDGQIWRIRIRRPDEDLGEDGSRYMGPRVFPEGEDAGNDHEAMYNVDALLPGRPAVLLEGEIDCLSVVQAAGDLAAPVATGSVSGARRPRWLARLARASTVLVALDADPAGDTNARYWLQLLPNARRWRPFWADPNQMARDGVDLRAWIKAGLPATAGRADNPWPITILWPATHPELAMPPAWRRLPDGRLKAVYYTLPELRESVQTLLWFKQAGLLLPWTSRANPPLLPAPQPLALLPPP